MIKSFKKVIFIHLFYNYSRFLTSNQDFY